MKVIRRKSVRKLKDKCGCEGKKQENELQEKDIGLELYKKFVEAPIFDEQISRK